MGKNINTSIIHSFLKDGGGISVRKEACAASVKVLLEHMSEGEISESVGVGIHTVQKIRRGTSKVPQKGTTQSLCKLAKTYLHVKKDTGDIAPPKGEVVAYLRMPRLSSVLHALGKGLIEASKHL